MRQIEVVAAIDRTDPDEPYRRRIVLHVPDLHRARMRAQQRQRSWNCTAPRRSGGNRILQVERVLHVPRGMIGGHIERFEVVIVVFDLGAFEHLVAEAREDLDHFIADQAERVTMAKLRRAAGQRDVDRVGGTRSRRTVSRSAIALRRFPQLVIARPSSFCSAPPSSATTVFRVGRPPSACQAWNSASCVGEGSRELPARDPADADLVAHTVRSPYVMPQLP